MMAWQLPFGAAAANLAGMQIRARLIRYGLTGQLSSIAIVQRANARHNPSAIYTDALDMDTYLSARMCPARCAVRV